jgi:hypothetical protein
MKPILAFLTVLTLALLFIFLSIAHSHAPKLVTDGSMPVHRAVIVELFTSEGCSSCPPADALLKSLSEQQSIPGVEIIALEEHVDYWDHLGWKDPFSNSEFTERQNEYARIFGNDGTYTPQMIVDGNAEFVGSRSREARDIIQKAALQPKAEIHLTSAADNTSDKASFEIKIAKLTALPAKEDFELWVVITEKGLHTDVKAGENSGELLQHAAVVRTINRLSSFHGPADYTTLTTAQLQHSWKRENLSFVIFAVEKHSSKIIAAASTQISAPR